MVNLNNLYLVLQLKKVPVNCIFYSNLVVGKGNVFWKTPDQEIRYRDRPGVVKISFDKFVGVSYYDYRRAKALESLGQ